MVEPRPVLEKERGVGDPREAAEIPPAMRRPTGVEPSQEPLFLHGVELRQERGAVVVAEHGEVRDPAIPRLREVCAEPGEERALVLHEVPVAALGQDVAAVDDERGRPCTAAASAAS